MQFLAMKLARPVWMTCVLAPGAKEFPTGTPGTAVRLVSGHYHLNVSDPEAEDMASEVYDAVVGLAAIYLGDVVATVNEG